MKVVVRIGTGLKRELHSLEDLVTVADTDTRLYQRAFTNTLSKIKLKKIKQTVMNPNLEEPYSNRILLFTNTTITINRKQIKQRAYKRYLDNVKTD